MSARVVGWLRRLALSPTKVFIGILLTAYCVPLTVPRALLAQDAEQGKVVYDKWCAGCHGDTGAGDGEAAAYMLPRPRDFTGAIYQIRTTASGELPTDDDLRSVIDNGMPGTTMPGWREKFSAGERDDVIAYLKSFSRFFNGDSPQPIEMGRQPGSPSEADLEEARVLFVDELQCLRCHGDQGRGDGPSAPGLTDDAGFPIRAADLSRNWMFNGGPTVEDIYVRMRTGLDGTPMPSNSDVVDAGIITDEQLWRVAQFVRSLSPEEAPSRQDVIRAARLDTGLPAGPDDAAWDDVEAFYVPLVGQLTVAPRWFTPTVDGLWVRAAHDGERLTMMITWNDPSQSPDPDWDEFFQGITGTMAAPDSPHRSEQGPDLIAVQMPLTQPTGMELPNFLGGDARRPVYMVQWTSDPDEVREGTATGMGTFEASGASDMSHQASFEAGRWRLQLSRSLVPADSSLARTLAVGERIRIGFYAADGTDGEDDVRGAVSAWYTVYLDIPTPPSVFVAPVFAVLLTAGLGLTIVRRAQRRGRTS